MYAAAQPRPLSEDPMVDADFSTMRELMIREIMAHSAYVEERLGRSSLDDDVMAAVGRVPRHEFVPAELRPYAYLNTPLPIGHDKTISQPFIVALMTDLLKVEEGTTVLEIGTGLGYQSAVLSELGAKVYSMEIIEALGSRARRILDELGYSDVQIRIGNGTFGWAKHAPFDRIIVTAAPDLIPPMLLQQLRPGGRMVIPTGLPDSQTLLLAIKDESGRITTEEVLPVRFSTMETGDAG